MPSAVADALLPAPVNPAQPPQGFWGNAGRFAYDALGLGDVAKALQGQMTPTEAQDFAFGAAMGLIPMSRGLKPVQKGIRAYHGSPHDFDRFDISKIGTGEGAQAYGHGLYFAENEAVAKQYRNLLATRGGALTDAASRAQFWTSDLGSPEAAIKHLEGVLQQAKSRPKNFDPADLAITQQSIDYLKGGGDLMPKGGKMYEVNINAHPDQFLDWDKPVAGAPSMEALAAKFDAVNPNTRRFLEDWGYKNEQAGRPMPDGEDIIRELKAVGDNRKQFSREAAEAGIPGIKYLDQGSRTAGDGSRNYVVFDDKLIDIIKKYGLAALGLPPAMTAGSQIWNSQTQQ
jgi:hypothetical protein